MLTLNLLNLLKSHIGPLKDKIMMLLNHFNFLSNLENGKHLKCGKKMLLKPSLNTTPGNLKKNSLSLTPFFVIPFSNSETLHNKWPSLKSLLPLKIKKTPMKEKPLSHLNPLKNFKKTEKKQSLIKSKKSLKNAETLFVLVSTIL
jgi:hypothetical protein